MYSTLKYIFTFLCSAVTLLLISQLFSTFVAERPTIFSKLEKDLEKSDLPDVVLYGVYTSLATEVLVHFVPVEAVHEDGLHQLDLFSLGPLGAVTFLEGVEYCLRKQ